MILGALRLSSYVKHRWPTWDFDSLLLFYMGTAKCPHYRTVLKARTFMEVTEQQAIALSGSEKVQVDRRSTMLQWIPSSFRLLYP